MKTKNFFLKSYKNLNVLVTGSTGFKGAWLSNWLLLLGAKVVGIGLRPEQDSIIFKSLNLNRRIKQNYIDINNSPGTKSYNTTGYFRLFSNIHVVTGGFGEFRITDGTTTKDICQFTGSGSANADLFLDVIVYLRAGESLVGYSANANITLSGNTRQIADLTGNLVNP